MGRKKETGGGGSHRWSRLNTVNVNEGSELAEREIWHGQKVERSSLSTWWKVVFLKERISVFVFFFVNFYVKVKKHPRTKERWETIRWTICATRKTCERDASCCHKESITQNKKSTKDTKKRSEYKLRLRHNLRLWSEERHYLLNLNYLSYKVRRAFNLYCISVKQQTESDSYTISNGEIVNPF